MDEHVYRHFVFWLFCSLTFSYHFDFLLDLVFWTDLHWLVWFISLSTVSFTYVYVRSQLKVHTEGKAVLITGCDSGFGFALAKSLYDKGCIVFAGCLSKDKGGGGSKELLRIDPKRLHVIQLDVTSQEQVDEARDYIETELNKARKGLWGIVNNAGIASYGFVEWLPLDRYKADAEVNVWGTVRVTKSFLPLLRKSKGRVVNISSQLGLRGVPGRSPYAMGKYSIEALSDCLRYELRPHGVHVSVLEPGNFIAGTNVWSEEQLQRQKQTMLQSMTEEVKGTYEEAFKKEGDGMSVFIHKGRTNIHPVVSAYESALFDSYPYPRYQPLELDLKLATWVNTHLPETIYELLYTR